MSMESAPLKKPKLLILEDDEDLSIFIDDVVRGLGVETLVAHNGEEGLRLMRDQHVDAVLSDVMMPKMNGLELLSRCQALGLEAPFAFVTGFQDTKNILNAVRLGACDFVLKPFEEQELVFVVQRLLAIAERQDRINQLMEGLKSKVVEDRDNIDILRRQIGMLRTLNATSRKP